LFIRKKRKSKQFNIIKNKKTKCKKCKEKIWKDWEVCPHCWKKQN
jgi:hypothetical protein